MRREREFRGWIGGHGERSERSLAASLGRRPGAWLSGRGIRVDRAGRTSTMTWACNIFLTFLVLGIRGHLLKIQMSGLSSGDSILAT